MTFKEKLVILRKTRGITQDEFASAVGVSRQAVYKWESGQSYPEVAKLLEIKLQYNISIDDLLDDTYDIPMPEKKKRKRISKKEVARIEEEVAAQIREEEAIEPEVEAAPAVEPVVEPAVEEPVAEAAPEVEAAPVVEAPKAELPKTEVPTIDVASSPKTKEEKLSLFDRLFGKK